MSNLIKWKSQDILFGLDFSSVVGRYKDFVFDIRYDYCGDEKKKPQDCPICMNIYFMNQNIKSINGFSVVLLIRQAEEFMRDFIEKYSKPFLTGDEK